MNFSNKIILSILFTLPLAINLYSQKSIPYSTLSNPYTGSNNQSITVNKIVADSVGNSYLLLKVLGKLAVNKTKVPDLLNDKSNAPSYQIIRITKEGEFQWGISSNNPIADIACDSNGNLYFCANDLSELKNSRLSFYQSSCVIIAENTNNILVKFSPEGEYMWSKKMQGEFYMPQSVLRIGYDNKLYYLMTKNGTRKMDHAITRMDLNGFEEWRTDIVNLYVDVFETAPDGKCYLAGYDYKVDEKKIVTYPFEISRYVLLEMDDAGTPKKLFDKKFNYNNESKQRIDFYINQIAFDTSNNPLFIFSGTVSSETPELNIANKKYRKNDGEFVFVQTDKKGNIIWDYQLKTAANINNRTSLNDGSLCLKTSNAITFTKNNAWLICSPTAKSILFNKDKKYELLNKTDLIYFELEPKEKGNINWITTAITGRFIQATPTLFAVNDSIFIACNQSTKLVANIQTNSWSLARVQVKIKKKPKVVEEIETDSTIVEEIENTIIEEETEKDTSEESLETHTTEINETDLINKDTTTIETLVENSTNENEKDSTNKTEIIENIETENDSSSNITNETITDSSNQVTNETIADSSNQIEPEAPIDIHALSTQLFSLPNGKTMLLEINKVPDDTLKASYQVEIQILDENGNNMIKDGREFLENYKVQLNIETAKWPRGIYTIRMDVGGKENAEIKIVKI